LDKPIGKRRLAVVNVGNDGEVSDVIHQGARMSKVKSKQTEKRARSKETRPEPTRLATAEVGWVL
jgi:hypothetical protein